MSSKWATGMNRLPAEIIDMIGHQVAEREDDGRPTSLRALARFSRTCSFARQACIRPLVYYITLSERTAPSILHWLYKDECVGKHVRKVSFRDWRRFVTANSTRVRKAIASINLAAGIPTSRIASTMQLVAGLVVYILAKLPNLRALLEIGTWGDSGHLIRWASTNEAISLEEITFATFNPHICRQVQALELLGALTPISLSNLKTLALHHFCGAGGLCLQHLSTQEQFLARLGSSLISLHITIKTSSDRFQHFTADVIQRILSHLPNLQHLKVAYSCNQEWSVPFWEKAISPTDLISNLVTLDVATEPKRIPWQTEMVFFLSGLGKIDKLLNLAIPFIWCCSGGTVEVDLPRRLEHLVLRVWYSDPDWTEMVADDTDPRVDSIVAVEDELWPLHKISLELRAKCPKSLQIITLDDQYSTQTGCNGLQSIIDRWEGEEVDPRPFKWAFDHLQETCRRRNVQLCYRAGTEYWDMDVDVTKWEEGGGSWMCY